MFETAEIPKYNHDQSIWEQIKKLIKVTDGNTSMVGKICSK